MSAVSFAVYTLWTGQKTELRVVATGSGEDLRKIKNEITEIFLRPEYKQDGRTMYAPTHKIVDTGATE